MKPMELIGLWSLILILTTLTVCAVMVHGFSSASPFAHNVLNHWLSVGYLTVFGVSALTR